MAENIHKQLLVQGNMLGTPIDGGYASNDSNETIILYGKAEKNSGMTIQEAVESFSKLGIGITQKQIEEFTKPIAKVTSSIRVILKQAYYYKNRQLTEEVNAAKQALAAAKDDASKQTAANNLKTAEAKTSEVQYAVWIEVDMKDLIPAGFIVDVDSVSLRIWSGNTPPKILEEMEITKMQELINSATKKIEPAAS